VVEEVYVLFLVVFVFSFVGVLRLAGKVVTEVACNVSSVMSCHIFPHNVFVKLPFKTR